MRHTLADELGIDPSAALQDAHLALLRGQSLTDATPAPSALSPVREPDEHRPVASYQRRRRDRDSH